MYRTEKKKKRMGLTALAEDEAPRFVKKCFCGKRGGTRCRSRPRIAAGRGPQKEKKSEVTTKKGLKRRGKNRIPRAGRVGLRGGELPSLTGENLRDGGEGRLTC